MGRKLKNLSELYKTKVFNNIEPEIIGSIENLQFIPWQENIKKSINYKKKEKIWTYLTEYSAT